MGLPSLVAGRKVQREDSTSRDMPRLHIMLSDALALGHVPVDDEKEILRAQRERGEGRAAGPWGGRGRLATGTVQKVHRSDLF